MSRMPYQVLVFPFRKINNYFEYLIFQREDIKCWQGIAGGGEGLESPIQAAKRETFEESNISEKSIFFLLKSIASLPVYHFPAHKYWKPDQYVIKEYAFATEIVEENIILSDEHIESQWVDYERAIKMLAWDSNKTALWELNERLKKNDMIEAISKNLSGCV